MEKNEKILDVVYPIVSSYPDLAHLFSMLNDIKKYEEWLYNYFIELEIYNTLYEETPRLDFYKPLLWESCPFIEQQIISKDFLEQINVDIMLLIKESIYDNSYILIDIDHFYIHESTFYGKTHVIHKCLLYGYNNDSQVFYIGDYFQNYKYEFKTITYNEFLKAYKECKHYVSKDIESSIRKYGIRIVYTNYKNEYVFDSIFLKNSFKYYVQGQNVNKYYKFANIANRDNWSYGIKVYGILKEYIKIIQDDTKFNYYPFRSFQLLYEHKKLMCSRLIFLLEKNYIHSPECLECFKDIKKEVEKIRNLFLLNFLNPKRRYLLQIKTILDKIEEKERKGIGKIIDEMQ